ncbi:hypothetical protein Ddc_22054 [Ditylenchus destructor]|nr:hypothetical protein Ddc_22054 [Ditylenchus destructor]
MRSTLGHMQRISALFSDVYAGAIMSATALVYFICSVINPVARLNYLSRVATSDISVRYCVEFKYDSERRCLSLPC